MSEIKRRDLLIAAAAASCGPAGEFEMPPRILAPQLPAIIRGKNLQNQIYRKPPPASPVHLSASLVLQSGASGAVPAATMKNPMGQDMEILEIKFELSGSTLYSGSPIFGGTVWCELTMGSIKLTNGSIPVWCFGRAENPEIESTSSVAAVGYVFNNYSWRLPRPLFVPAGAVVTASFTHTGFVKTAVNVRVGYSGRTVFTKPKKLYVPWVSKFLSKAFNPLSAAGVDTSSELDLVNPHPEVFHLQRFVGRTLAIEPGGGSTFDFEDVNPQSFGSQYLTARITDSYGRPIVRNFVPFYSIFSPVTRSWEMDNGASLDPEAYYIVNLKKDATVYDTDGIGQAFISMVGWREMENPL